MTGLERNGDVVRMASYAPLFANSEAWQWTPNLIWVDTLNVCRTPNYYVQQLFSRNQGDQELPITPTDVNGQFYACAARDNAAGEIIVKLINASTSPTDCDVKLNGASPAGGSARAIVLGGEEKNSVNSFLHPDTVAPIEKTVSASSGAIHQTLPASSMTVLRVKVK
jgi:alpha-N-arabinofuranosidase